MKTSELKKLSDNELQDKLKDLKEGYFKFRFQHKTSQLNSTAKLNEVRKDIARVKTLIKEMQLKNIKE